MLAAESRLHRDLRARGYQLYLEPAAKTSHVNASRLSSSILLRFYEGQEFAALRVGEENWPPHRRLLYVAGAPLIPFVQLRRLLGEIERSGRGRELLPRILPDLIAGVTAWAVGEALGYLLGAGNAPRWLSAFEFHRTRHLRGSDRPAAVA